MPSPSAACFTIHLDQPQGALSPLWFGHNLEHTRSSIWQGLSAQLLRNRKFAGHPEQLTGQALGWEAIGAGDGLFLLDAAGSYTRHVDPAGRGRRNEARCQRLYGYTPGTTYGLAQGGLPLRGGTAYELRLVLRSPAPLTVSARLLGEGGATLAGASFAVTGDEWAAYSADLPVGRDDSSARLEITFTGPGELAVGCASLLPAGTFLGLRRDVMDLLREIGTPLLRWPGGNFAGDYRWQDGLLPVDERAALEAFTPTETLPHTGGYDMHELGTDEFLALCRELGAEPYLSINLAWDEPADAAAWVQYCNGAADTEWGRRRAERGHPEPYRVRYWSLGNELGYGHMEGPNDAAGYAVRARAVAEAMRAADPTIELVASGLWHQDPWYTDCLAPLSDLVGHISHHWYQGSVVRDYAGPGFAGQYQAMIAAPQQWLRQMGDLRRRLAAVVPAGRAVGIAFDEWNTWYAWYRTPGVAEGLYAAGLLDAFCHHAAEVGMSLGCYFEPVNEGAIVVQPHAAHLTAVGQVQALYRAHHGNTALTTTRAGAETVLLTASADAAGTVVLTLANTDPEAAEKVEVALLGGGARHLAEGVLLRQEGYLPGSVFTVGEPAVTAAESGALSVAVPPMSLVRLTLAQAE